jgi:NAD(P)H-dependent FMN reductase
MNPIKIKVIVGSTRPGRFSEKPAQWIADEAKKVEGVEVEVLDLRDYPMPFFDEPESPSYKKAPYTNPVVQKWTAKIADGDAFIVVTPEYNHSPSAVVKNAFDYVGSEWNKKPIAFVSYGSVGGARAIQQLRLVAIELQMVPVRQSVHIFWSDYMAIAQAPQPVKPELFAPFAPAKDALLEQLVWAAKMLKAARG